MIELALLQAIQQIVANFVETTHYIHSKFVLTELGGFPLPLTNKDDKYPAVLSQIDSVKYSKDLSVQTISLSISYLRPTKDDFSDVPETILKGKDSLMQILYYLLQDERYEFASEVVMNPLMHKSELLLSGAVASVLVSTTNEFSPCC